MQYKAGISHYEVSADSLLWAMFMQPKEHINNKLSWENNLGYDDNELMILVVKHRSGEKDKGPIT